MQQPVNSSIDEKHDPLFLKKVTTLFCQSTDGSAIFVSSNSVII